MNVKFRIESIFESHFYLKQVPPPFNLDINSELLNYEVQFEIKINEKKNLLVTDAIIEALYSDIDFLKTKVWPNSVDISDEDLQTFLKLNLVLTFNVDPLSVLVKKNGSSKELDKGLLALVSEVTLSTARGIIFAKSQGSIIREKPLPYISSSKFIIAVEDLKTG